MLTHL